jgi:hypothetical protein
MQPVNTKPFQTQFHVTEHCADSFLPILIFPQTMSPSFRYGFPSILAFSLMAILLVGKFRPHNYSSNMNYR